MPASKALIAASALASLCSLAPARAQDAPATPAAPAAPTPTPAPVTASDAPAKLPEASASNADTGSGTDILSFNTFSILLDGRFVLSDGNLTWAQGGLSKARFDGTPSGKLDFAFVPVEADLMWQPRFTRTLTGNVSAAAQRDQENAVDLIEAFVTWLPPREGKFGFSAKGGLYWPEISLEHATGGAWSTVYTITPSAINAWVGEEVKVIGLEGTFYATLGQQDFSLTGSLFGFNDTSGTLLSFRGWALHDAKATAFGHFPLPPLNSFMTNAQQHETKSLYEIDNRPGFYLRFEWKPPQPLALNIFYYDNRGDPAAFTKSLQWGWRTRFVNVGLSADLGPNTRLLLQGMKGATQMGFTENGETWVHTRFQSAYALITQSMGKAQLTGRLEFFGTREHGSEMSPLESEDGWAITGAGRYAITNHLTSFLEAMYIDSTRGVRTVNFGIPAEEGQTVVQLGFRYRL
jgi:hypothetical protein